MTKIELKVEEINKLNPTEIPDDPRVEQKFIDMFNSIWGTDRGRQIYEKEKFNFQKVLNDKPAMQSCSRMSLFGCFLDIAVNGLSLDPTGRPHCYMLPRNTKTGYRDQNGNDVYEWRAYLSITGYGELVMRERAGQVRYIDNPVVCYEGDVFSPEIIGGVKTVTYKAACPRKSNKVIGGFLRIVRADGTTDWSWMMEGDIERLKDYSFKNNQRWNPATKKKEGEANKLYSSQDGGIDSGFMESKLIKHAFDGYPKVKTGKFTLFESQEPDDEEIDYGIDTSNDVKALQPNSINPIEGFGEQFSSEPEKVVVETTQEDENAGF